MEDLLRLQAILLQALAHRLGLRVQTLGQELLRVHLSKSKRSQHSLGAQHVNISKVPVFTSPRPCLFFSCDKSASTKVLKVATFTCQLNSPQQRSLWKESSPALSSPVSTLVSLGGSTSLKFPSLMRRRIMSSIEEVKACVTTGAGLEVLCWHDK